MSLNRPSSALGLAALVLALASPSAAVAELSTAETAENPVRIGSRCEVYVNDKRMTPYLCYGP